MPYEWSRSSDGNATLRLWPYRSLQPKGFVTFIAVTACFFLLPLLAVLGSPILWALLPFIAGTLWLTWAMIQRNYRDGALQEELNIQKEQVTLVRTNPRGPEQRWGANPYWVQVSIHKAGGPVQNYVTLRGAGREVEIGAFLSPQERVALYGDLRGRLQELSRAASPRPHLDA